MLTWVFAWFWRFTLTQKPHALRKFTGKLTSVLLQSTFRDVINESNSLQDAIPLLQFHLSVTLLTLFYKSGGKDWRYSSRHAWTVTQLEWTIHAFYYAVTLMCHELCLVPYTTWNIELSDDKGVHETPSHRERERERDGREETREQRPTTREEAS